jgi:hypothetical protein
MLNQVISEVKNKWGYTSFSHMPSWCHREVTLLLLIQCGEVSQAMFVLGGVNHLICTVFVVGGAFEGVEDTVSPFGYKRGEGIDAGSGEPEWIVSKERYKYDAIFDTLNPVDGKVTGAGKLQSWIF